MDGNKDEARKCVKMGKEALEAGDSARALRFLTKARRLDPTLCIDDLLSFAGGGGADMADDAGDTSPTPSDGPRNEPDKAGQAPSAAFSSATLRARGRSSAASTNGSTSTAAYTEEQIAIVREIKKKKDYYEILGLERSCTVEDVRKAYRKLSLKVHPDKNKAPGAEEAFKAVSKSFQCLSNEESRQRYDVSGSDDPTPVTRHHQAYGRGFNANGFYDADIDAEEIFRNFFGGMHQAATPFGTFHFRTGGMGGNVGHGMQGSGNFNIRTLVQILPILVLILFNFLPSSDPLYTFNRSYPYEHKVLTSKGVPFYVKSTKFEQDYPYQSSERVALEASIQREYVSLLSQNCRLELQRKQWGFQHQTPHCDMLQKFQEGETA
ncbi:chaperone protein dnaJ 49-like [Phalaenopsis equestris]|uniref:chaperone protein dnaJ 49-like n=1 Tax=Phalaenopsis equestris TaxID=78828 RepID=UPI0009E19303|nr:chaperone protein dnaJ 49-like [Phalaenopsis equestris]XP_020572482.1 chaperone protein dnaJ 49-like [Phalaenopsis equestris]XP_020572483.1 chaperone protein dnaJ 49-like [Phalaenopsis equestris]XP_020572484.1 chaperone protein dnaJ 49-like [Phalaenopsis equestris]XP_020572486.1 chaperone protein dnaJ 49-like [Phalaenopsis equestris]XP_020572487.1 chaperone protein dnaJ 49-like [Phalaenopsis equestris]XP_020572488.1 chaperone protein dnaJ 49-like [Phalaenopsis equestris]